MSETFFICQAIFDVMVVLYLVVDKFIQKRQKVTFLTLMDMAKNLMEKERILAEKLKSEMANYQKDRQELLEDIKQKNEMFLHLFSIWEKLKDTPDLKDKILNLEEKGYDISSISKKLNLPEEEVKLFFEA
ncbi:MAG: hypothetical protein KAW82_06055 [Desulfurellaceae bacterium]|jgi:DNA-binding NarL/FixJ family response regulator|nr:hypothetical protein [Desulfurellaceae bacterium]